MGPRIQCVCRKLLLAAGLCLLPGCFGGTQNPSYFPHLLPTGDIIRTHAKPPGPSYFSNFDPHAIELAIAFAGADHVLAGSDYPHQIGSIPKMLAAIRAVNAGDDAKRKILGENAMRLLKM